MWCRQRHGVALVSSLLSAAESNVYASIYVYVFLVIGSFFSVNLFIGVMIDKFNRLKEELDGSALLTPAQRQWVSLQRYLVTVKPVAAPPRPRRCIPSLIYSVVAHRWFDACIMGCIVSNTITMGMEHWHQGHECVRELVCCDCRTASSACQQPL